MSQDTPALPTVAPEHIAGLTPEGKESAINSFVAAGFKRDALVAQFNSGVTVAAVAPDKPAPNAERQQQWRALEKGWTGDRATLVAQAAKSGVDLTQDPAAEAAVSEASLAANRASATLAAVSPPAAANDYGNLSWPNANDITATELGKQDTLWKDSLFKSGIPKQFVQQLIDAAFASAKTYESKLDARYATDEDRAAEDVALRIRLGEEAHRVRVLQDGDVTKYAQIALDAFPAAFRKALDETHALSTAESFAALSLIGKAISQRIKT